MGKWRDFITDLFSRKVDAIGLSVFRICYAVVLFCELAQLYRFRHLVFDKNPYIEVGEFDITFLFRFWFVFVLFLALGLFTRITTIVNYLFAVIVFSSVHEFEYHVFYAYISINLLMIFMPVSRVLSLDSLIQKVKYSGIGAPYSPDRKILEINYLIPVFAVLGLVYFDSIFFKMTSNMWMTGLGVWLPSSLPMLIWTDTSIVLNQEWFVRGTGYFVVFFETVFIFLFWFKRWRVPLMIIGLILHLGILVSYPIPWFALTAVVAYFLMVPQRFWLWISDSFKFKKKLYTFYYDAECPLCAKVVVVIKHIDIFGTIQCKTVQGNYQNDPAIASIDEHTLLLNIHGVTSSGKVHVGFWAYVQLFKSLIYTWPIGLLISIPGISHIGKKIYAYIAGDRLTERCTEENCSMPVLNRPTPETTDIVIKGWNQFKITQVFWKVIIVILIVSQSMIIWDKPIMRQHVPGWAQINKVVGAPYRATGWYLLKYAGITIHPVFMYEMHFDGYNHIFRIDYQKGNETGTVPLGNEKGMQTPNYINGFAWVNYTFRVNSRDFNLQRYEKGVVPYLRHFEAVNGKGQTFTVYVKVIDADDKWQPDFLKHQIEKPWQEAGKIKLDGDKTHYEWNALMQKIAAEEDAKNSH